MLTILLSLLALTQEKPTECPRIITRAEWGAKPPKETPVKLTNPVKYVFIHHTFIPKECHNFEDCAAAMRSMQRFHQDDRGWSDIGYSFVFGSDGNVYEGRGWDIVGAHTKGYNSVGYGFSAIGDFNRKLPPKNLLKNVKNMIKCGMKLGKISQNYTLRGHRDMKANTDCPGNKYYRLIRTWPHY